MPARPTGPPTVRVPAGWFRMGSENHFPWERPGHRVFVDACDLAMTALTRSRYEEFLERTGHDLPRGWDDAAFGHPDQPVVGVSWHDAAAYCRWLSEATSEAWRLPTEAEWERAARGGDDLADYAWGSAHPDTIEHYRQAWLAPRRVGDLPPNKYGLFNMGDNVHEWCSDWYGPDYYSVSPARNPQGPPSGDRRVSRGGSWRHAIKASRAAHRSSLPPDYRYTDYGFRIVRSA